MFMYLKIKSNNIISQREIKNTKENTKEKRNT